MMLSVDTRDQITHDLRASGRTVGRRKGPVDRGRWTLSAPHRLRCYGCGGRDQPPGGRGATSTAARRQTWIRQKRWVPSAREPPVRILVPGLPAAPTMSPTPTGSFASIAPNQALTLCGQNEEGERDVQLGRRRDDT